MKQITKVTEKVVGVSWETTAAIVWPATGLWGNYNTTRLSESGPLTSPKGTLVLETTMTENVKKAFGGSIVGKRFRVTLEVID